MYTSSLQHNFDWTAKRTCFTVHLFLELPVLMIPTSGGLYREVPLDYLYKPRPIEYDYELAVSAIYKHQHITRTNILICAKIMIVAKE